LTKIEIFIKFYNLKALTVSKLVEWEERVDKN